MTNMYIYGNKCISLSKSDRDKVIKYFQKNMGRGKKILDPMMKDMNIPGYSRQLITIKEI